MVSLFLTIYCEIATINLCIGIATPASIWFNIRFFNKTLRNINGRRNDSDELRWTIIFIMVAFA